MVSVNNILASWLNYLPTILAAVTGTLLLIAFFVGLKKGVRRVSWAGAVWLASALVFFALQAKLGDKIEGFLSPFVSKFVTAELVSHACSFILAIATVLVALLLNGLLSLIFRPRVAYKNKQSDAHTLDEDGVEYDEDYEDYDDYEDYGSRREPVYSGCQTPSVFGRILGSIMCMINMASILIVIYGVLIFALEATPLGSHQALQPLYEAKLFGVTVMPLASAYASRFAMDTFVMGILVAFACKGNKNGLLETIRVLIVNVGSIVAVILCFYLPFSKYAGEGGNYFLHTLVDRCRVPVNALLGESAAAFVPVVSKIVSGFLLAVAVVVVVLLLNWLLKKLVDIVENVGFLRVIDGALSGVAYLIIGIVVVLAVWIVWYILARVGVFNVTELFSEGAVLSNGIFKACEVYVEPFLQTVKGWFVK